MQNVKKGSGITRILFDGSILASGNKMDSSRSGIFMVSFEILKGLLNQKDFQIDLFVRPSAVDEVKLFLARELPDFRGRMVCAERTNLLGRLQKKITAFKENASSRTAKLFGKALLFFCRILVYMTDDRQKIPLQPGDYSAFITPFHLIPCWIRSLPLKRFTILYDAIPMLFPEFYPAVKFRMSWKIIIMHTLGGMIGGQEILLILLVVLVLFGGKKIPELMKGLGKGVKEYKNAVNDIESEISSAKGEEKPAQTAKTEQKEE